MSADMTSRDPFPVPLHEAEDMIAQGLDEILQDNDTQTGERAMGMTREQVAEDLKGYHDHAFRFCHIPKESVEAAIAHLRQPSAAAVGQIPEGWVSVDDRMPEPGIVVLVAVHWRQYVEDDDGREFTQSGVTVTEGECQAHGDLRCMISYASPHGDDEGITHWMPMPTAPGAAAPSAANALPADSQPDMRECGLCNGVRFIDGATCPHCDGEGKVEFAAQPAAPDSAAADWIGNVIQTVAELGGRNSPENWPEAMLVTADELRDIISEHMPKGDSAPNPSNSSSSSDSAAAPVARELVTVPRSALDWMKRYKPVLCDKAGLHEVAHQPQVAAPVAMQQPDWLAVPVPAFLEMAASYAENGWKSTVLAAQLRKLAAHQPPASDCNCVTGAGEWSGSPSEKDPDNVWECDACGRLVPVEPPASDGDVPASLDDVYLCRAWGESDQPCVEICRDMEGVRKFIVREWLGDNEAPALPTIMTEIAEIHDFQSDGLWHAEFEIGGVSVDHVHSILLPDAALATAGSEQDAKAEIERLTALLNTPELHDFAKGAALEAAHQRERWGTDHDGGKEPADWFWLIGYLAGKALRSHIEGSTDKALHHTITAAAALANWHAAILGQTNMRPGIAPPIDAAITKEKAS